ncbi:sortase [Corynebacterium hindlerae]|uniref:sortase n=1 Tax=Corynebacterium hindlerae TaxID=699041 RepID=UPI001AD7A358|nr:sortase [Corynebacterium hindlerae]QTH59144.1 sortase [Corynebacterium hindlerae]
MRRITAAALILITTATLASCGKKEEETAPAPQPSISETPTPTPTPTVNVGPPPAATGSFTMDGPAAVTGATYDSMPYVLPLNPAGPQDTMVRWVEGWGVDPSKPEAGTMYVLGHAWGQQKLVFNSISEVVTAAVDLNKPAEQVPAVSGGTIGRYSSDKLNGSRITMTDSAGNNRQWIVDNAWLVDKYDAIEDKELVDEHDPGRLILIACSVSGAQDLGYNVIVSARLAK